VANRRWRTDLPPLSRAANAGVNISGSDYLACAGIELCGRANFERPLWTSLCCREV
jgi:hypothetical protein